MNRLVRLKELVRVNEGNKLIVKKLRAIRATYDVKKWDQQFNQNKYMHDQIRENASNYLQSANTYSTLYEESIFRIQWNSIGKHWASFSLLNSDGGSSRFLEEINKELHQAAVPPILKH